VITWGGHRGFGLRP